MDLPSPDETRRVVLVWIGRLGDILVATPAMAAIRRRFPRARITLVTGEAGAQGARLCPDIDDFRVLRRFWRPIANARLALSLLKEPADILIDLNSAFSRGAWTLARVSHARAKIAFRRGRGDGIYTRLIDSPAEDEHMLDRYGRLAAALGAPYEPRLRARIEPADRAAAAVLLKGLKTDPKKLLVGIHPGNFKKFDNRWPEERFIELTDLLAARGDAAVIYLAGPREREQVAAIVSRLKRPVPIIGPLAIGPAAGLIAALDLLVVNVTGTAHLAAAVGTPTFSFRSRYTQNVWMPRLGEHYSVVSASWESCRDIPVATAYAGLKRALKSLNARRG